MAKYTLLKQKKITEHVDGNDCERPFKAATETKKKHKNTVVVKEFTNKSDQSGQEKPASWLKMPTLQLLSSSQGLGTSAQVWFWRVSGALV